MRSRSKIARPWASCEIAQLTEEGRNEPGESFLLMGSFFRRQSCAHGERQRSSGNPLYFERSPVQRSRPGAPPVRLSSR